MSQKMAEQHGKATQVTLRSPTLLAPQNILFACILQYYVISKTSKRISLELFISQPTCYSDLWKDI